MNIISGTGAHQSEELLDFSTDNWCTPPEVSVPLEDFFGGPVGIDPATNDRSIIKSIVRYTELGLALPWYKKAQGKNRSCFMNEPYSISGGFTDKANDEMHAERVTELVRLTTGSPSTAWWRRACKKSPRNPRIIFTRRLSFIGPHGKKMSTCRFEPALLYYGPRVAEFERAFKSIQRWTRWGR